MGEDADYIDKCAAALIGGLENEFNDAFLMWQRKEEEATVYLLPIR